MAAPFIPDAPEWHEGPNLEENWQERYSEPDNGEED